MAHKVEISVGPRIDESDFLRSRLDDLNQLLATQPAQGWTLFLDSCGPALGRHYILLKEIQLAGLSNFREIHAVSGGIFSIVGFWAFTHKKTRRDLQYYIDNFDKDYRSIVHRDPLVKFRFLGRAVLKKPLFEGFSVLEELIHYCFDDQLISMPIQEFPVPFFAYLKNLDSGELEKIRVGSPHEKVQLSIGELLAAAVRIPQVYGISRNDPRKSLNLSDGAFHPHYRMLIRELDKAGHQLIVSTPWKKGQRGNAHFINVFAKDNPKSKMFFDFARLVLNLENRSYAKDLTLAFEA